MATLGGMFRRAVPPPLRDAAMALVLLVWAVLANASEPFSPGVVLIILPLAGRRRWPTAVAVVAAVGIAISVTMPLDKAAALPVVVAILTAAYSCAAYARRPWVGLVLLAAPLIPLANDRFELPLFPWLLPFALVGSAWLAGVAVRRRAQAAQAWRERAEQAERERASIRARDLAEERARIARELHDVVTHRVSLMVIQ